MAGCAAVQNQLEDADVARLAEAGLHQFADELQQGLSRLHDLVTGTYFGTARSGSAVLAASS
jgi:A predicted alpha-helical domain with a conserved ER motif.